MDLYRLARGFAGLALSFSVVLAPQARADGAVQNAPAGSGGVSLRDDPRIIIRDFFRDRRGGFFVDVGAFHWERFSTTHFLEKDLGWSGIAIDALAHLAPGWKLHRPASRFFVYIVTDHSGSTESFYMAGPISSTSEDWVKNFPNRKREPVKVEVPTITLNDLLDRNGVTHIDFLSMDIEGGEPAALRGFDIGRFKPELVCIEAGIARGPDLVAYFHDNGYERIDRYLPHDYVNWYFRAKDSDAGDE